MRNFKVIVNDPAINGNGSSNEVIYFAECRDGFLPIILVTDLSQGSPVALA